MKHPASFAQGKRLLSEGHVLEAIDHFQGAIAAGGTEPALEYGLFLARSRATPGPTLMRELDAVLARPGLETGWRWQFLSIQAKLLKAEGERDPARLAEAAERYLEAHRLSGDPYPGVNAASLLFLCGREPEARALAASLLGAVPADDGSDYWGAATRGELCVLLGHDQAAVAAYAEADRLSRGNHGDRASIRRQLRMLQARSPALCTHILAQAFERPPVAVFSGHRVDDPGAVRERFPASAEPRVAAALARFAAAHAGGVSYCSAASGGDILFAEAMLAAGTRVHIVLPVPPERFVEESVRPAGPRWVARCEALLAQAARVVVAHHAVPEVPGTLYQYTNLLSDGLAQLHAEAIDGELAYCALLNPRVLQVTAGGTREEVARWESRGYPVTLVDPLDGAVRTLAAKTLTRPSATLSRGREREDNDTRPDAPLPLAGEGAPKGRVRAGDASMPDTLCIRAMLFADLVGSSRFDPQEIPALLGHFLGEARRLIAAHGCEPLLRNTWGDGLFLVFEHIEDAARMATFIAREIDWPVRADGLAPSVRVSLHAGPVIEAHDAILDRSNVFGHHVIRAARVEPVTPPGEVFATEEAAALLRATGNQRFECVYMGRISMPKGFGETPIYRVDGMG